MAAEDLGTSDACVKVEVVWAEPDAQAIRDVVLPLGSTVADAVEASGLEPSDDVSYGYGIYGRVVHPDTELRLWDRVEIYRPLLVDPMEARRQRATAS